MYGDSGKMEIALNHAVEVIESIIEKNWLPRCMEEFVMEMLKQKKNVTCMSAQVILPFLICCTLLSLSATLC